MLFYSQFRILIFHASPMEGNPPYSWDDSLPGAGFSDAVLFLVLYPHIALIHTRFNLEGY